MDEQRTHVVLGAGGAIGLPLAQKLISRNARVKLVSRHGHVLAGASSVCADLTDADQTRKSIERSSVVYLVAGLPYAASVWQAQWPKLMQNTIAACQEKQALLIFFDNVYMYGKVEGIMTEQTPVNPCSRKGEVRARIAETLLSAIHAGNLTATIARSADFYGPFAGKTSIPNMLVLERMIRGKKAQWLADAAARHSLTYTLDCAEALALLGATEDSYNQLWHLPTARPALSGSEFIQIAAEILEVPSAHTELKKWMLQAAGLFDRQIREAAEMIYQSQSDYLFDSTKFETRFSFAPTPYAKGIRETIAYLQQQKPLTS